MTEGNYISLKRKNYRGSDPKMRLRVSKYNEDTAMLEAHINQKIQNSETRRFIYAEIAHETGLKLKRVRDILFQINCGTNGFSI